MHVSILKTLALGLSSAGFVQLAAAETFAASDRLPLPAASTPFPSLYNVVWETPGLLASGSMPTGNGDLSVNVWVEEGGDLLFYVGKTDSWSELERLLKVGRVRVKLSPNPFLAGLPFRQELKLEDGTIAIRAGAPGSEVSIRLYADAHHPVIRFECTSEKLVEVTASTEIWRSEERDLPLGERHSAWGDRDNLEPLIESADVLVPDRRDDVMWYHRNASSIWEGTFRLQGLESLIETRRDPLLNRTFGVLMRGPGFHLGENGTLRAAPALDHELSLHVLTSQTDTPEIWEREIEKLATESDSTPRAAAWLAHQKWWSDFWDRSHVIMSGPLVEAPVITSVPVPLRIGGGDGGSPFHGKIARARLHRDSLSAQEIELLAVGQDAPSPRSAALVGDWDLAQPDAAGDFPNLQGDPLTAKPSGELLVDAADNLPIFSGPAHLLVADDPRLDPSGSMTLDAWVYAEAQPASGGANLRQGSRRHSGRIRSRHVSWQFVAADIQHGINWITRQHRARQPDCGKCAPAGPMDARGRHS